MTKILKNSTLIFMLLVLPLTSFAQKDVTQFLGIPVDGSKSEMIQKLKEKGFTTSQYNKDVLNGEFNGIDVNLYIVTNNNKVCRIMVVDVNTIGETDIKIRYNKLLQQFKNNKNYSPADLVNNSIPEGEDISYELVVKKKRYEAVFYQKPVDYESLNLELESIYKKEKITAEDYDRVSVVKKEMLNFNKVVWFMISDKNGKYGIALYYDNELNRANGEGL